MDMNMIEDEALETTEGVLNIEDMTEEELEALEMLEAEASKAALKKQELREKLGQVLTKHRNDAVTFRGASGIERQWTEDQAYFEGQDELGGTTYYKGTAPNTPMLAKPKAQYKSKVFLNITRAYVEAAASKVIEVLTPTDMPPWSIEPTSIPQLPETPSPVVIAAEAAAAAAQPAAAPGPDGQPAQPTQPEPLQESPLELAVKAAKRACKGAELWIQDKLEQCNFTTHTRMVIDEASRLGTGVMRGPIPTMRKSSKTVDGNKIILEEIIPESRYISVWDCYPDPACGDNIHDGQFFIEHDRMVEKQVLSLKEQPGYLAEAIDAVIEEGPMTGTQAGIGQMPHESQDLSAKRYHVWYFHGFLQREDVMAMGCFCEESDEIEHIGVPVVVTMINNTPVKAHLNPCPQGSFPYDFVVWQRIAGSPFGIGVARQIRSCQAILNANVRALMENAGLSSGPQILIARGAVTPADGSWVITPRKVWLLKADSDVQDVSQAMSAFQIPSIQAELLSSVDFALKMAENVTGLPVLMQGQQGPSGVPETVGGMQILVANASSLLRRMARVYDDSLIKPHIQAYYRWMMNYADDASIKGDFRVVAHGSSSLVIRDQRNQFLVNMVPTLLANPSFGIDPTRLFKRIAEISGLQDPESIMFTPQEMQALQAAQAQVPDPKVQIATANNETKMSIAQMDNDTTQVRISADTDRDTAYVQAETERTQVQAAIKLEELKLKRELMVMELALRDKLSVDTIKAQLASTAASNDLARELATLPTAKDVATGIGEAAAIEPAGKAPDGFAQSL